MKAQHMRMLLAITSLFVLVGCAGSAKDPGEIGGTSEVTAGLASYYGHQFHGRLTANGETYDENAMTAAHRTLSFGTKIRVTNQANGKVVVLRVNDRGPFVDGRIVDVSFRAAKDLEMVDAGVVQVHLEVLP
ncbi:MAG: rare lipoprotein A [Candidatus Krumholzibacteriia bacterium]|jgi:rare lipoprotein A